MSCLLSYYNTVPFPLQSNLRSVFCTFCIPHLFQLLKNPGCGCAGSVFSHLKCKISTSDCAGSSFFLLKCTISTPDCAEFGFPSLNAQFQPQIVQNSAFPSLNAQFQPDCAGFALSGSKCIISPWNYAKQRMSLGISSRQSAALVISHFPQAHTPHPCEVFLLYKRSLSFKTNKKEARSQASSPAAGHLISPILFQSMAILAERFYVIGRTVL